MKKILSILLFLALCLGLCACGNDRAALSSKEEKMVGEWANEVGGEIIVLTDSGRGLIYHPYQSEKEAAPITWEVFEGKLYIYLDGKYGSAYFYSIVGNNLIDANGDVCYSKK